MTASPSSIRYSFCMSSNFCRTSSALCSDGNAISTRSAIVFTPCCCETDCVLAPDPAPTRDPHPTRTPTPARTPAPPGGRPPPTPPPPQAGRHPHPPPPPAGRRPHRPPPPPLQPGPPPPPPAAAPAATMPPTAMPPTAASLSIAGIWRDGKNRQDDGEDNREPAYHRASCHSPDPGETFQTLPIAQAGVTRFLGGTPPSAGLVLSCRHDAQRRDKKPPDPGILQPDRGIARGIAAVACDRAGPAVPPIRRPANHIRHPELLECRLQPPLPLGRRRGVEAIS